MKLLLSGMMLAAGLFAGCTQEAQPDTQAKAAALAKVIADEHDHVTVPALSDWIIKDRRDFELLDIRDAADFVQGHIKGARNVPLAMLLSVDSLATLPQGRKVVVYSNGTAHAAQAVLLLRLVDRDAYALLGGFNHWQAYLHDPAAAGVAEMDPVQRAQYQAVACFFAGDYVAGDGIAGAAPKPAQAAEPPVSAGPDPLGLGLGLGLGSNELKELGLGSEPKSPPADPLGLGLDLGLGGEAAESLRRDREAAPKETQGKLLIKAEC